MPLSETGSKVLKQMKKRYGKKKGTSVFYATMKKRGMKGDWENKNSQSGVHKKLIPIRISEGIS